MCCPDSKFFYFGFTCIKILYGCSLNIQPTAIGSMIVGKLIGLRIEQEQNFSPNDLLGSIEVTLLSVSSLKKLNLDTFSFALNCFAFLGFLMGL